MTERIPLPNKRRHEVLEFDHDGVRYTAGVGRFVNGALAEIFLNGGKPGSAAESNARDAAIILSIALQEGASLQRIVAAMTRLPDGRAAGPMGHLLDLLLSAADGRE